jgi:hypothetical protein
VRVGGTTTTASLRRLWRAITARMS